MESWLFTGLEVSDEALTVEGWHKPGSLTLSSGVWIHAAGGAMLERGEHLLQQKPNFIWLAVVSGRVTLACRGETLCLEENDTCVLPAARRKSTLTVEGDSTHVLWLALEGPLAPMAVRKLGALLNVPLRQAALPSQMYLAQTVVQVIVRHSGTSNATYQLQHLLYGLIASHWGQPVSMDAMLSHEIAKVVDWLRADQYRSNPSLAEMAAVSRMPMETFRKRFVAEVGMPPLSYLLRCKMERAKELLREPHSTVRQVGADVGMQDPYHFSKQFKAIVGISPSVFIRLVSNPEATIRKDYRGRETRQPAT